MAVGVKFDIDISGVKKGASESEKSFEKIGKAVDDTTKKIKLFQDAQGRWRRENGQFATSADKVADGIKKIGDESEDADTKAGKFAGSLSLLKGGIAGLIAGASIATIVQLGKALIDASVALDKLDKAYQTIYGSQYAAQEQMRFLLETSRELGAQYVSMAESAKTFFAAGVGSDLEKDMNKIFFAFTKAGTALSLSSDQMQGAFLALGQMISKGKVQAEELRGQLGERLPGAFQLAAKAMGMTTAELDKFMADGKLLAEDLLPKMADEMENKFAKAAEEAASGVQQSINRMSTEWELFKASLLDSDAVASSINSIASALRSVNSALEDREDKELIISELEKRGVKKEGVREYQAQTRFGASFSAGYSEENKVTWYTDEQIENMREVIRLEKEAKKKTEELARANEKAISEGRKAIDVALSGTQEYKKRALSSEYEETIARIDAMIEAYKKDGVSYEEIVLKKKKITEEYNSALASLNKKESAKPSGIKEERITMYSASLGVLRNNVDALNSSTNVYAQSLDEVKKALIAERDAAIKNADIKASEDVRRKLATESQAAEMSMLEKQRAQLEYMKKLREAENNNLEGKARFYEQLSEKTGQYEQHLSIQNELLERQRQIWIGMGIPIEDVDRLINLMSKEMDTDIWAGLERGVQKYAKTAKDAAANIESVFTSMTTGVADTLTEFVMTSKLSFKNMADDFLSQIIRMQINAAASGLFSGLVDKFIPSLFGGSEASGGRPEGGWDLNDLERIGRRESGGYVERGMPYIVGEKRPELFVPSQSGTILPKVPNMGSNVSVPVSVNIINQTGTPADTQVTQQRNDQGGLDINVMLKRLKKETRADIANDIRGGNGGVVAQAIQGTYGVKRRA